MPPPALTVVATDPITRDGACSWFRASSMVRLLPPGGEEDADVTVVFAHRVTDETLAAMRRLAGRARHPMRFVLVADHITRAGLIRAVRYGLVGFVARAQCGMDQVLQAVLRSREEQVRLPDEVVTSLIEQIGGLQGDVLEPHGPNTPCFEEGETAVLRLIARGMDAAAVARQLNYSHRMVRSILGGVAFRLGLCNRTQAIVYAMRAGVI